MKWFGKKKQEVKVEFGPEALEQLAKASPEERKRMLEAVEKLKKNPEMGESVDTENLRAFVVEGRKRIGGMLEMGWYGFIFSIGVNTTNRDITLTIHISRTEVCIRVELAILGVYLGWVQGHRKKKRKEWGLDTIIGGKNEQ